MGGADDMCLSVAALLSLQEVLVFEQILWQQKSPVSMAVTLKAWGTLLFNV